MTGVQTCALPISGGKNPAGMDAAMEKAAEVVAEQVK